jgi:hypothetical protein
MTIHITDASPDGVPLVAICSTCEPDPSSVWHRPPDDPTARTLAGWVRLHHRKVPLRGAYE